MVAAALTAGRCGGGMAVCGDVREDSGRDVMGVLERRSE